MNAINLIPAILVLTGTALFADPSTNPQIASASVDPLVEALPVLQAKYVDFKALQYKDGDHLNDLITRSNGEISLLSSEAEKTPPPIFTTTLPGNVVYWRLASFTPEKTWDDLGTQLGESTVGATGFILDLRSTQAPDDYIGAGQVMALFAPSDSTFLKFRTLPVSNPARALVAIADRPVRSPIIVLTNPQTSGAAELLAACLKADGALVIGRPTAGKAAVFEEQPLSTGQVLRFAASEVQLIGGAPLFGHPVVPDINLNVDNHNEKGALVLIAHHNVQDVIGESTPRHLMNEASLIQGNDPEWDEYLDSLKKKPVLLSLPVIHDQALISALDSLKAIQVSQRHSDPPTQTTSTASLPQTTTSVQ